MQKSVEKGIDKMSNAINNIDSTAQHSTAQHSTAQHSTAQLCAVIPSVPNDIDKLLRKTEIFFKYIPIKKIYIVGPVGISERIISEHDSRLIFINENEFVDVPRIRELYSLRALQPRRAGWYVQQFIKMQFAKFVKDDYYLIWDSDTIPLKPVELFDEHFRPFFDMKTEYHESYFDTLSKILPGIHKVTESSFISEHMLIKKEYMCELIDEIEANKNLEGTNFQERIINAIAAENLPRTGFSEFETYGSYVTVRHPDSYAMREWHSLRCGKRFYTDSSLIDEENRLWLSTNYDAISLEKWHRMSWCSPLVKAKVFHKLFSPVVLESIPLPLQALRKAIRGLIPDKYVPFIKRIIATKKGA